MFMYLNEPSLKTIVLFAFRFGLDIKSKASSIHLTFWKDLNEPSIANEASSANILLLDLNLCYVFHDPLRSVNA